MFILLIVIILKVKRWKHTLSIISVFFISYAMGIGIITFSSLTPNITLLTFLVPLIVFLLAIFYNLKAKNTVNVNIWYIMIFTIVFGFLNGTGTSHDFLLNIDRNQLEIIPLIETAIGAAIGFSIIFFSLFILFIVLQRIIKIENTKRILIVSNVVLILTIPILLGKLFQ